MNNCSNRKAPRTVPRMALLLFGISSGYNSKRGYNVNFTKSVKNYKTHIYKYFIELGYDIDVYMVTNILPHTIKTQLESTYRPVNVIYVESHLELRSKTETNVLKNEKWLKVMELVLGNQQSYELIILTRFDLMFQIPFETANIQLDKFNIVSELERPGIICDNFFIFPFRFLKPLFSKMKTFLNAKPTNMIHHSLEIIKSIPDIQINFIKNEGVKVAQLTFYKLWR